VKEKIALLRLRLLLTVFVLFLMAVVLIGSSCTCPIFSLIERLTGVEVKVGDNIDESLIEDGLIYPDSKVLLQVEGDIETVMEIAGRYGAIISEKDIKVLDELPQEVMEQEIGATIYSTADKKEEVMDYYNSFDNKEFDIKELKSEEQVEDKNRPAVMIASDGNEPQAFVLVGAENGTFIMFLGFDWETLLEMGK